MAVGEEAEKDARAGVAIWLFHQYDRIRSVPHSQYQLVLVLGPPVPSLRSERLSGEGYTGRFALPVLPLNVKADSARGSLYADAKTEFSGVTTTPVTLFDSESFSSVRIVDRLPVPKPEVEIVAGPSTRTPRLRLLPGPSPPVPVIGVDRGSLREISDDRALNMDKVWGLDL
ncbi:hypothetical protein PM082_023911 [Marasmius tenuissimus]|nr:hypothetical protein PM082_023911 [Marasmius tenuissimus]